MKQILKYAGIVAGALFLVLAGPVIILLITPFAFGWKVYVSIDKEDRKARDIASGSARYFVAIASCFNKFGNVAFGGFFNAILLRKQKHPFGNSHENLSEVLGWGERYNDLTPLGEDLLYFVNFCDPFDEDHCKNAMLSAVETARRKVETFNLLNPQ